MNAFAGSLCPASEATDAIPYGLFAQIHDFNVGACLTHTFYQGIEHHCGIAISPATGAGIQCKDFHTDLLCFFDASVGVCGESSAAPYLLMMNKSYVDWQFCQYREQIKYRIRLYA
jgi:hypothetical protein